MLRNIIGADMVSIISLYYVVCRVTIGTWNVAGRVPNDDLDIEDWLCTQEPSDVYIIG